MSGRRWFNVGVVKLPHADRDVAHDVLGERPGDRYADIVGADTPDDDERFPVGSNCTYRAWLSDDEAARFAAASNCRYVSEDVEVPDAACAATTLPGWRVRDTLGYWPGADTQMAGTTTNVAVFDGGSSSAARAYMGHILVTRATFWTPAPPAGEPYPGQVHGSLCAGNAVSPNGRLYEAVVLNENGAMSDSTTAQAVTWAVDQGVKVVSASYGSTSTTLPATRDAILAANAADIIFYFSTGNEGDGSPVRYPARYGIEGPISYLYSVGGWDMSTSYRWVDSTWHPQMTGVAPSILVRSVTGTGLEVEWYGTSAAVPCVANLAARLVGAGATARQAGAALAATGDQHGYGTAVGGGVFNLAAAARHLGIDVPLVAAVPGQRQRAAAALAGGRPF